MKIFVIFHFVQKFENFVDLFKSCEKEVGIHSSKKVVHQRTEILSKKMKLERKGSVLFCLKVFS